MVQPAESRKGMNLSVAHRANFCCTTCGRLLRESKMRPVPCPPTRLNLEIHVQYKRNPARSQFTTVRGVTKGFLHPDQNTLKATQNSLCRVVKSTARSLRVQSQQLLMENQVLKDEVLMGAESAKQPADQMSERHDHVKNLTDTSRVQLCAKSFILQVYDVLARHSRELRHQLVDDVFVPVQAVQFVRGNTGSPKWATELVPSQDKVAYSRE